MKRRMRERCAPQKMRITSASLACKVPIELLAIVAVGAIAVVVILVFLRSRRD